MAKQKYKKAPKVAIQKGPSRNYMREADQQKPSTPKGRRNKR